MVAPVSSNHSAPRKCNLHADTKWAKTVSKLNRERAFAHRVRKFPHARIKTSTPSLYDSAYKQRNHRRQKFAGRCDKSRNLKSLAVRDDSEATVPTLAVSPDDMQHTPTSRTHHDLHD